MTHAMTEIVPDKKAFHELEKEAVELGKSVERTYMEMGRVLCGIRDIFKSCRGREGLALKQLGYETFEEWVVGKLKYTPRKAYYLADGWQTLHIEAGIPKAQLENVGWTKARALTTLVDHGKMNKENAKEWLEKARTMDREGLENSVKNTLREAGAPEVETLHRATFSLFEGQMSNLKAALETAAEITGSDKPGHCLDTICMEYNAAHIRGTDTKESVVARIGAKLQELFGVTVIVVDKGNKSVLFGQDEIKALDNP